MFKHMRTTVHLPDDLLKRAKKKAADEGRTLTSLLEEGLRLVLVPRPDQGPRPARRYPRVSKASGGLRAGIDPAKIAAQVQEMEDLEYAERMRKGFK